MTARTILLTLHLAFVACWLGANVVQLVLSPRFDKTDRAANIEWNKAIHWLGQRFYAPVGVLVLLTGIGLVTLDSTPWEFGDGFVMLGIGVVILGAILGVAVFTPLSTKRIDALEAGDAAAAKAAFSRIVGFGIFDTTLLLVTVLAMVHKWQA